jgi:hypothetical protein
MYSKRREFCSPALLHSSELHWPDFDNAATPQSSCAPGRRASLCFSESPLDRERTASTTISAGYDVLWDSSSTGPIG